MRNFRGHLLKPTADSAGKPSVAGQPDIGQVPIFVQSTEELHRSTGIGLSQPDAQDRQIPGEAPYLWRRPYLPTRWAVSQRLDSGVRLTAAAK